MAFSYFTNFSECPVGFGLPKVCTLGYCHIWGIVRLAQRFCRCNFGLLYSASLKLEQKVDAVFSVQCTLYSPQLLGGRGCVSNSGTLASNRQNTASPKYNDDNFLLIEQYLISEYCRNSDGECRLCSPSVIY